ncbi:MAG: NAD(P)-binding protein [Aliarcobacter sp.]|nr:NAD(P)-binding protein [Aliarcobacter sp.]
MKIAIIGAGFSGCNLYNNLKEKYEDITIFEKSRGVGGRLSTKYIEDKFIDYGTSSLIPVTDDLKFFCLDLAKNGVLKAKYDEFIPKDGINKICKFLIDENNLLTNTKITKAENTNNKWTLEDENHNTYEDFDLLFITIPAPQILQMKIELPDSFKEKLSFIKYDSIFSLILYTNENLKLNENKLYENPDIKDIINNSKKYLYKDFSSYVIHSSKEFANCVNEKSKDEICEIFLDNFDDDTKELIEKFTIIPHLWKYAFAKTSLDMPYFLNEEKNLGICGDYFSHNNVEASLLSSELLGNIDYK